MSELAFNVPKMVGKAASLTSIIWRWTEMRRKVCARQYDFRWVSGFPISNTVMAISVYTGCKAWVSSSRLVSRNRGGIGYRPGIPEYLFRVAKQMLNLPSILFNVVVAAITMQPMKEVSRLCRKVQHGFFPAWFRGSYQSPV